MAAADSPQGQGSGSWEKSELLISLHNYSGFPSGYSHQFRGVSSAFQRCKVNLGRSLVTPCIHTNLDCSNISCIASWSEFRILFQSSGFLEIALKFVLIQGVQMHTPEHYIVLTSGGKRTHFQKKYSEMMLHQIIFHMKLTSLDISSSLSRERKDWEHWGNVTLQGFNKETFGIQLFWVCPGLAQEHPSPLQLQGSPSHRVWTASWASESSIHSI